MRQSNPSHLRRHCEERARDAAISNHPNENGDCRGWPDARRNLSQQIRSVSGLAMTPGVWWLIGSQ